MPCSFVTKPYLIGTSSLYADIFEEEITRAGKYSPAACIDALIPRIDKKQIKTLRGKRCQQTWRVCPL